MTVRLAREQINAARAYLDTAMELLDAQVAPPSPTHPTPPDFDPSKFFASVRDSLFDGSLNQGQVDGLNLIGKTCWEYGLESFVEQAAYVLATVFHETDRTMQPIEEYYGSTKRYAPWYGRGHVMITWEENYEKQQLKHGAKGDDYKVHDDRNRALIPEVSAVICVGGMTDGDFTGKALNDYIRPGFVDYVNARRIVNGTDKADMIAGYARKFEAAIRTGFA